MSTALAPTHFQDVDVLIYSSCLVGMYDKIKTLCEQLSSTGQCVLESMQEDGLFQQVRMVGSSMPVFIIDQQAKQAYICNTYVTEEQEDIMNDK